VPPEPWLAALEEKLAGDESGDELSVSVVVLASVAGEEVHADPAEVRGAARRALLLLTAGGDPERGLDLRGRAVSAMADDLRTVDRQLALEAGIADLVLRARGLPHVSEALRGLASAPDVAWRAYAAALLAEELGRED
jgi:hypothetical protein